MSDKFLTLRGNAFWSGLMVILWVWVSIGLLYTMWNDEPFTLVDKILITVLIVWAVIDQFTDWIDARAKAGMKT